MTFSTCQLFKCRSNKPSKFFSQAPARQRQKIAACFLISAFCLVLYANTLPSGYTFDDNLYISKFTRRGLAGIKDIFSHDMISAYFGQSMDLLVGGRYRPLAPATLAVEHHLFGLNANISHAVNVILYALSCVVLYLVTIAALEPPSRAVASAPSGEGSTWYLSVPFLATLLYAAHPLHTEVVATIKGRDELLAWLGSLAALWLALAFIDRERWVCLPAAALAFFLALLAKENAATFMAVIPLTVLFFRRQARRSLAAVLAALALALAVYVYARYRVLGSAAAAISEELMNNPFLEATLGQKYATILYTFGLYVKLLFFPHPLTYDYYPYHIPLINPSDPRAIIPLLFHAALAVWALLGLKKKTVAAYGICFYLITFSVVSNIFFPIGAFMAERVMFIPSWGYCLVIASLLTDKLPRLMRTPIIYRLSVSGMMIVCLSLLAVKTVTRNRVWRDDFTLFTTDVVTSSGSAFGNYTAGKQYLLKARGTQDQAEKAALYRRAISHLGKAVAIHPKYINGLRYLSEAVYEFNNDWPMAIDLLERLSMLAPAWDEVYLRLGILHGRHTGNMERSIHNLVTAIRLNPARSEALGRLASLYYNLARYGEAVPYYERYLALRPEDETARKNLASARLISSGGKK